MADEIEKRNNHRSPITKDLEQPVRNRPVSWWWVVTALTIAIFLGIGSIIVFRDLARIFALVVIGVSIANALAPVVNWLEEHAHFPRGVAILVVVLILLLIFAGIVWVTIPVLASQVNAFIKQMQAFIPKVANFLSGYGFNANDLLNSLSSFSSSFGKLIVSLPVTIFDSLVDVILVIFVSIYWLALMNGMVDFVLSFYPKQSKGNVHQVMSEVGNAMGGYLRGAAIDGLIFGTFKFIGLTIIGVPYALTLGIIAASLEFFPTIGAIISAVIATLVALSVSPTLALITLGYTILLQQAENHILVPLVMRSQTTISPLLAILAVVSGAAIGGIVGALAGIPVVTALDVLIRLVIAPALRKLNGVREGAEEAQAARHEERKEEEET